MDFKAGFVEKLAKANQIAVTGADVERAFGSSVNVIVSG